MSARLEKLLDTFTKDEFAVARALKKEPATIQEIASRLETDEIRVHRAFHYLEAKGFVTLTHEETPFLERTEKGKRVADQGLPERRFLTLLEQGPKSMNNIRKALDQDEFNVSVGILKRANAIEMGKDVALTKKGTQLLKNAFPAEEIMSKESIEESSIPKEVAAELLDRGLYERKTKKRITAHLRDNAKKLSYESRNLHESLSPEMIKNQTYKTVRFRAYDVTIDVPPRYGGRRHFVNEAIEFVRSIWIDMGFKEMRGDYVQTSFWNFDALFTAQDHPARDMQDTFFLKNPERGALPEKKLIDRIKQTHENGWTTGSSGYGEEWKRREASRNVLRTHTTCLSAQTLAKLNKKDLPAKYFSVGKVFRNETVDWKHLFEFEQVEGIVVDKNVTFPHLKGYLEIFFRKLGYERIRLRPAFFPYTEMSVEIDVYHPTRREWIELGGSGIFRPEVVKPLLGVDVPVLAWGLGFGRILTDYYEISDLRDFNKNDLTQLRTMRGWI